MHGYMTVFAGLSNFCMYNCPCVLAETGALFLPAVQNVWQEVLRCVSRWELLQQIASGGPTDAHLFAAPSEPAQPTKRRNFFSMRRDAGAAAPRLPWLLPWCLCCGYISPLL